MAEELKKKAFIDQLKRYISSAYVKDGSWNPKLS
jgi:hypothetical protein